MLKNPCNLILYIYIMPYFIKRSLAILFLMAYLGLYAPTLHASAETEQQQKPEYELKVSLPSGTIRPHETITVKAWLTAGSEIAGSGTVRYLAISAYIKQPDGIGFSRALFDNGLDGDERQGDGIFTCRLTPSSEGEFTVSISAEGKGLRKNVEQRFSVAAAPPEKPAAHAGEKQDEKAEHPDQPPGSGGLSWGIFIALNAAALVFWLGLSALMYMKLRKRPGQKIEMSPAAFSGEIRKHAEETMKRSAEGTGSASTSDAKVISDMHGARQIFLKAVCEQKKGAADSAGSLWETIYKGFDNALKEVLKGKKSALDEIGSLQEKVEEIDSIGEELKEAKSLSEAQAKKISFLMGFKDVIAESKEKFEALSKKNRELEKSLYEAAHAAGLSEKVKGPIDELQENYRQLELCISTLENENERLVEEVIKWKKEFEQASGRQHGTAGEEPAELQELKEKIEGLESTIKAKDRELLDLRKSFESLEAEYMVLYQEKQAGQSQPDL